MLLIGLMLVLAACGSDSTGDTAGDDPADSSAGSSDELEFAVFASMPGGTAMLEVPAGSLPEGVSQDDVQIEAVMPGSTDDSVPLLVVGLAPSGIALSETATLTVTFEDEPPDATMVIHSSGDTIEFLEAEIAESDTGPTMSVAVEHFSIVAYFKAPFETSIVATPQTVEVEQTQTASIAITQQTTDFSVFLRLEADPAGTQRMVTFSAPRQPIAFTDAYVAWGYNSLSGTTGSTFEPPLQPVEISGDPPTWNATASAVCKKPSAARPHVSATVSYQATLLELGEPQTRTDWKLSAVFSDTELGDAESPYVSDNLLDHGAGDILDLVGSIIQSSSGSCVAAGTAPDPPPEDPPDESGVKDAEWHYRVGLAEATANLESITDCDELTALWESFSFDVGNDDPEIAARALELDDIAYQLRKKLGC